MKAETNGACVVCGRPQWTTTVALAGRVSPFNACHREKGDPITFNTIDCYKTAYQNRTPALTLAQQEARAEREVEVAALRRIERLARELMPYINHLGDDGDAICSKLRALLEGK